MGTIGGALRYITTLLVCVASFIATAAPQFRHSRAGGNLAALKSAEIPACAGMTGIITLRAKVKAAVAA